MLPGVIMLGFVLLFAGMWTAVSFFLSRMAGWPGLSRRYAADAEPAGQRLLWNTAQVDGVSFRTCLNLTLSSAGLYMVPALLFRLFMPPVLIPWSDVRFEGYRSILFFRFACYRLGADGPLLGVWHKTGLLFRPYLTEDSRRDLDAEKKFVGPWMTRAMRIALAAAFAAGVAGFIAAQFAARR